MSKDEEFRNRSGISVSILVLVGIFSFAGAYTMGAYGTGYLLRNQSADSFIHTVAEELRVLACKDLGFRHACRQTSDSPAGQSHRSWRRHFAAMPDLKTALADLTWNRGAEAEAARLLSVISALELGRQRESLRALDAVETLVRPVWNAHPELVAASACIYCGNTSKVAKRMAAGQSLERELGRQWATGTPSYFGFLAGKGYLTGEEERTAASIFAQLFTAGDARTASQIGGILIEGERFQALRHWVAKGLNGGRALDDVKDLSTLPRSVVETAWEHGVGMGYDSPKLSEHLLSQGYRPALRWVVWLQDGAASYISADNNSYRFHRNKYEQMLKQYLDFPAHAGAALGAYYSEHWRNIDWDGARRLWRVARN